MNAYPITSRALTGAALALILAGSLSARQNRIDVVTPTAPELAAFGSHAVGVRTLTTSEANRPDILNATSDGPIPRYTRTLTMECWYPADVPAGTPAGRYDVITRDPAVRVTLFGRAVRDAAPARDGAPFPLVIISHGYPGNRFLMSHLGENLASKGYVVVSIDHPDSTYDDQ